MLMFSKTRGEVNAVVGSDLSLFGGIYHEQSGSYGSNLVSKSHHVFLSKTWRAMLLKYEEHPSGN